MSPRIPSYEPLSAVIGLFAGSTTLLLVPPLTETLPDDTVSGAALLVGLLAWTAVEQVPGTVDRAVRARAYLAFGAVSMVPVLVIFVSRITGGPLTSLDPYRLPALGFVLVGGLVVATGETRRATLVRETERVHVTVTATEKRTWRILRALWSMALSVLVARMALGALFSASSIVGIVIGAVVGSVLAGTKTVELAVVDSGLVASPDSTLGTELLPWRRVRSVDFDGETLSVRRGLPWPMVYRADLSENDEPSNVADIVRQRRRQ